MEGVVHVNRHDALVVSGKIVRDVFKRQKRRGGHQELAEEQRRGSWLAEHSDRLLGRPGAGIV
jgi:hypothetical protein